MIRLRYYLREIGRNLYRYPGTAVGSILSLTLIFLLFDLFWVAAGTSNRMYQQLLTQVQMEIFVSDNLPDSVMTPLAGAIADIPGIKDVRYVSREDARLELTRLVGTDLLTEYDTLNPLPRSFILDLDQSVKNLASMEMLDQSLRQISGVTDVSYSRDWLSKAEETRSMVTRVGMILGLIILLTAVINSGNNIRLMTRARGGGYGQMLLLGAGRWFLALPLMLEGFLLCLLSAVLSWGIVLFAGRKIAFSQFAIVMPPVGDIALFCGAAALLGFVSGYVGVRKLLR
ncbi:hypothetical protein C3F09_02805 [candidate division GN15 bacterium]|uniref:Cell division protein FtsX n=1 Tax=candidate division GN15 bacterium TaxID=2072418 RepID=A0A855X436_9BACT|nr:MAG: hypothetical protein C3F09_02805 [candidate division GN15 bacterium]